jgi:two-component system sensor kinase FixL
MMFESRFRAILDTAVDGVILMDAMGVVTMFNPACERMFGYPAADVIGGNINTLMPPPYHGEHDQYLANYRATGQRKIIGVGREVKGRRSDGGVFPLELSVGEASHDGEVFYVGIVRDVTERQRAAEQREHLIEQLTASNEERSHFVHAASHDLREPLRMVAAFCGLLSKGYGDQLDERGREYLQLAVSSTTQMQALLDDLVDFGRLGLEAERSSTFSPNESLDQVLETLRDPIAESHAEVTSEALPEIRGNPVRFQRLLQNLIGNGIKYVPAGVTPRLHLSVLRVGEFWRFSVSDNGIGIEPRHHQQIFDPFTRLHAKSAYFGTGLGLAICRKIVEGFGGYISVCSAPGKGSTFSFTVKIQEKEGHDAPPHG